MQLLVPVPCSCGVPCFCRVPCFFIVYYSCGWLQSILFQCRIPSFCWNDLFLWIIMFLYSILCLESALFLFWRVAVWLGRQPRPRCGGAPSRASPVFCSQEEPARFSPALGLQEDYRPVQNGAFGWQEAFWAAGLHAGALSSKPWDLKILHASIFGKAVRGAVYHPGGRRPPERQGSGQESGCLMVPSWHEDEFFGPVGLASGSGGALFGGGRCLPWFQPRWYTVGKARVSLLLPSDISVLFHEHT